MSMFIKTKHYRVLNPVNIGPGRPKKQPVTNNEQQKEQDTNKEEK